MSDTIIAAIVGSLTTVLMGTAGALLAIWRFGKEAKNAITLSAQNEALRLKLKIYEQEVLPAVRDCIDHEVALTGFIRNYDMQVSNYVLLTKQGFNASIPAARVPALIDLKSKLDNAAIAFITFVESWIAVDDRIAIFQTAVNSAKYDIDIAYNAYFQLAVRQMPYDLPAGLSWQAPDLGAQQQLEVSSRKVIDELSTLTCFAMDFKTEMQNALIAGLFGHKAPVRKPLDSTLIVITLDNYAHLSLQFEKDTAWGKHKAQTEEEVRAILSS